MGKHRTMMKYWKRSIEAKRFRGPYPTGKKNCVAASIGSRNKMEFDYAIVTSIHQKNFIRQVRDSPWRKGDDETSQGNEREKNNGIKENRKRNSDKLFGSWRDPCNEVDITLSKPVSENPNLVQKIGNRGRHAVLKEIVLVGRRICS
ncbi:hypothetical protein RUM43_003579 [Polyplax serrata]|uniref:Uncharacterized protein n=1 Tax=Polyplax serrata TaxID=468196 RepID=A0AAN8P2L1_POLSC